MQMKLKVFEGNGKKDMDDCDGSLDIIVTTRIVSLLVGRFNSPKMDAEISFMRRAYSELLRRARV